MRRYRLSYVAFLVGAAAAASFVTCSRLCGAPAHVGWTFAALRDVTKELP